MDLDGLCRSLLTLLQGPSLCEASWKSRNGHDEASALLRFHHDRVATHNSILSQGGSELLAGYARLGQDRPEQSRSQRLACVQRNSDPTPTSRMLELGMRTTLDNHDPAESPKGLNDLPAGDTREQRHRSRP